MRKYVPLAALLASGAVPWSALKLRAQNCSGSACWNPFVVGAVWTMYNVGNPRWFTTFTVDQAAPGLCGNPQVFVRITKTSDYTYWGPGSPGSVDYYITVDPDGTVHSPFSIVYDSNDASGSPDPNRSVYTQPPSNQLIPADPAQGYPFATTVSYVFGYPIACTPGNAGTNWTTNIPSMTSTNLVAKYTEGPTNGSFLATELWTFTQTTSGQPSCMQHLSWDYSTGSAGALDLYSLGGVPACHMP